MDTQAAWLVLYSGILSMHYHPGNKEPVDFKYCAGQADFALVEYRRRFPTSLEESSPCRG